MLYFYHTWSEETLMQVKKNDDLLTFMEVKGQQRSNIVNLASTTGFIELQPRRPNSL